MPHGRENRLQLGRFAGPQKGAVDLMDNAIALPTTPQLPQPGHQMFCKKRPHVTVGPSERRLPFLREHDCEHPGCHRLVVDTLDIRGLIQVDLPEDTMAGMLERAEVMLAVRVVVWREFVERPYTLQHRNSHVVRQCRNTRGHIDPSTSERPSESIIQLADEIDAHRRRGTWFPRFSSCRARG